CLLRRKQRRRPETVARVGAAKRRATEGKARLRQQLRHVHPLLPHAAARLPARQVAQGRSRQGRHRMVRGEEEMSARCWLMKVEPESYTIEQLERDGQTCWEGVRNYQARNMLRDDLQ